MASNESNLHFAAPPLPIPPPATLKTYPTRRRIIRKSSRNSIRLTTLKKGSTIPSNPTPTPLDSPTSQPDLFKTYEPFNEKNEASCSDSESLLRLFSCVSCGLPLRQPVTLECGHTCCKGCARELCPECGTPVEKDACVNVLVRSIVSKLIGEDLQERDKNTDESKYPKKTHFFHPYNLRYRHGGKHKKVQKLDDGDIHNIKKKVEAAFTSKGMFQPGQLTSTELECVLCCRWLRSPVTTRCGHTFCRSCLDRVLDHGLGCPLCMGRLSPGHHHTRPPTRLLQECVNRLCPVTDFLEKETDDIETDTQVPVFICTSAFPSVACPLYVYEPRYRLLTRRCLQSSTRRFAMAAGMTASHPNGGVETRFAPFGTILEVRDAVHLRDGRSILTTVGLRRFRVIDRGEKDGYDTATVEYIKDQPVSQLQMGSLRTLHERVHRKAVRWVNSLAKHVQTEIEQSLGAMPAVEADWPILPDGPSWAWWLMPVLPLSTQLQVGFLSTTSLEKRLRAIEKMLERMSVRMRALKRQEMCERQEETIEGCGNSTVVHRERTGVEL